MGARNSKVEVDAENGFYNPSKHQGVAIIFNQEEFDSPTLNREGSRQDEEAMERTLSKFKLGVKVERNNSANEILSTMRTVTAMDHSTSTCIVVVIMTHGNGGGELHARDNTYNKKDIIDILIGSQELVGKPKIIIIQACRGQQVSRSVRVHKTSLQTDSAVLAEPQYVPEESELIICYSTYEGKVAYRDSMKGTIFIQAVSKVLDKHGKKDDIQKIFTRVRNKVAKTEDVHKQMPTTESTLTEDFCLGDYLKYKNSISVRKSIKKADVAVDKKEPSNTTTISSATTSRTFNIEPNATLKTFGMGSNPSVSPPAAKPLSSINRFENNISNTSIGLISPKFNNNSHQKQNSSSSIGVVSRPAIPVKLPEKIWNPSNDLQSFKKSSDYSFKTYGGGPVRSASTSTVQTSSSSSSSYKRKEYKSQSSSSSSTTSEATKKYQQSNKNNWPKK